MTTKTLPQRERTTCADCGKRRLCFTVKVRDVPGVFVMLCDECVFLMGHDSTQMGGSMFYGQTTRDAGYRAMRTVLEPIHDALDNLTMDDPGEVMGGVGPAEATAAGETAMLLAEAIGTLEDIIEGRI